ncbi:MAG: hypothetical protein R3E96_01915 [Planctomycetota bacterium]
MGSVVASLLGRKRSRSDITAAAKAATRARREKADVRRAEDDLDQVEREYRELEKDLGAGSRTCAREFENRREELEELRIAPRKTDIQFDAFTLIWVPYHQSAERANPPPRGDGSQQSTCAPRIRSAEPGRAHLEGYAYLRSGRSALLGASLHPSLLPWRTSPSSPGLRCASSSTGSPFSKRVTTSLT